MSPRLKAAVSGCKNLRDQARHCHQSPSLALLPREGADVLSGSVRSIDREIVSFFKQRPVGPAKT